VKQIPPAVQEEKRYIKFKIHGEEKDLGEVVDAVWSSALSYMGTKGVSKADLWIIGNRFDEKDQTGVIRVHRDKVDDLRAAITINPEFNDNSFLSVEDVSGTISGLEE